MKFGIITLVSDNYGNKYQNYAVEQIFSEYGDVETFGLENLYQIPAKEQKKMLQKLNPAYIREVLISRPMYRYDLNRIDKGICHNLLYCRKHHKELLKLRQERNKRFSDFASRNLHISSMKLNRDNTSVEWSSLYDYFICGSDQIWNPSYRTTSELAFCSFAPEKTICFAPSFGVSQIPEYRHEEYSRWLKDIYCLAVREKAGQKIIKDLTGRKAEIFLDPTMLIPVKKWNALCVKPQVKLPDRYIVCYFLGRITKEYKKKMDGFAQKMGVPVVMLFDITRPDYYTLDPAEVLYVIKYADYVLTDSFHGTVFSILFHKSFTVFTRNEGKISMNSRLETLLEKFGLETRKNDMSMQSEIRWDRVENILKKERVRIKNYLNIIGENQ